MNSVGPPAWTNAIADAATERGTASQDGMTSAAWRENAKEVPDMIFFDADHRYEVMKKELEWAKAKGVKIIAGHDYGNPNPRFGVTRAVDEVLGPPDEVVGMCWMKKG